MTVKLHTKTKLLKVQPRNKLKLFQFHLLKKLINFLIASPCHENLN